MLRNKTSISKPENMKPTLLEVQDYFFEKGDRNTKSPLQFFAYYQAIGWPQDWKKQAYRYFNKNLKP